MATDRDFVAVNVDAQRRVPASPATSAAGGPCTMMLTWLGVDAQRLETARVLLSDRGMRAAGSLVAGPTDTSAAFSASYSLLTDEGGRPSRLSVQATTTDGDRQVNLNRSEEGIWLVDHGQGNILRGDFDGAVDVDLAFSPLFNTLPIRRLHLHRSAAERLLPTLVVGLPTLEVTLAHQTYRTVSIGADEAVVGFAWDDFAAELTVDAEGLVVDYPGLARRLPG